MKNELAKITELIARQEPAMMNSGVYTCFSEDSTAQLEQACSEAREAWASVVFSDTGKNTLRRYFTYQMRVLSGLLDGLNADAPTTREPIHHLIELADHLYIFFAAQLDMSVNSPVKFARYKLFALGEKAGELSGLLKNSEVNPSLKICLISCLDIYFAPAIPPRLSLGTLNYLELLLEGLLQVWDFQSHADISLVLEERLIALNFNHLEFFRYLVKTTGSALESLSPEDRQALLLKKASLLQSDIHYNKWYYDPALPPVALMYKDWLKDEASAVAARLRLPALNPVMKIEKIGLNLSVAELACLVRLFFEAGLFLETGITEILKSIPLHFAAKYQPSISNGSFSTKYYSSEQKAAAKVKALLLKMIAWLNKHYFPVVVVAGAVIAAR